MTHAAIILSVRTFRPWRASEYPAGLRFAALVLPALLLAALIALDYFVLGRLLPPGESQLVEFAIGLAGVVTFSLVMFGRLSELHAAQREQSEHLARLAEALEGKRQQLQALNAAGMSLSAELASETVLQKVADLARDVANARYAALGVFDGGGEVVQFLTAGLSPEERARIGELPRGRGILGLLQREKRPLRLRDLAAHPAAVGFPANHPPMRSFVGVPIVSRGRSLGNLYLTEKRGVDEFTADDEEALLTLAAQAAIAIENARLYEQVERMTILEERHRIGMDLHDGAIQSLYGLGLLIEDAAERIATAPEEARRDLARAVDRLNAGIADLRSYVIGLRPIRGSDRPLTESLPTLAEQVGANALLTVRVDVDPKAEPRLGPFAREAVYYIAADALGNVARHARARRADVRLAAEDARVVLEIRDDGVGFEAGRAVEGLGLRNMRERAFSVGGLLHVESEPGQGTRVRLEVPVESEAAAP